MKTSTAATFLWDTMVPVSSNHDVNISYTTESSEVQIKASISKMIVPGLMFFVGVFGNVLALVILHIWPSKDSRSTAFYHLVKALAVVDLTGIVALSPVPLATQGQLIKAGGMALCNYFSFAIILAGNATLSIVIIMTIERFMVNKFPLQYDQWVTHRKLNIALAILWVTSALYSALPIIGVGRNSDRWPGTWCFFDFRDNTLGAYFFSISYATTGIIIILITFILNTSHIIYLWRARRKRLNHTSVRSQPPPASLTNGTDAETRMVRFLMAIILVFTLSYSPLMIRVLVNQFQNVGGVEPGGHDDQLDVWAIRFASFNQIIDPWIYIISRFTCCRSKSERNSRSNSNRSPDRATLTSASISSSPRKGFIVRGVQRVRSLFTKSEINGLVRDNTMEPLNVVPKQSNRVTTNSMDIPTGTVYDECFI